MKAVTYHEYGPPSVLACQDIDRPTPKRGEVVVRVVASAINPGDWDILHGRPMVLRPSTGLFKPKHPVLGLAVAGTVEVLGAGVTAFRPGDKVFGEIRHGGFAEYASVPQDALAPMPRNLTFEQAAAVPVVGPTALAALRDVAQVKPGQKVLINGAAGGVGTFAVQIARAFGAEVTGVCSGRNVDLVRSLGADHVVDYTQEDFTAGGWRYDAIFDNVGNRSMADCRRALAPDGTFIPNSNKGGGRWLGGFLPRAAWALLVTPFVSQRLRPFAATSDSRELAAATELIEAGKVTPVIDRTYPLAETAAALAYYGEGHTRGKVVIKVAADLEA